MGVAQAVPIAVSCETLHEPLGERSEDRYCPFLDNQGDGLVAGSDLFFVRTGRERQARGRPPDRGQDQCGQATKGMWGMSWRQEATKGAEDCDKSGGAVKRALIPECPNHRGLNP